MMQRTANENAACLRRICIIVCYRHRNLFSHGNSLFTNPHTLDFKMLVIFSSKNIKRGHKLKLRYLYACGIMHMKYHKQICKCMPEMARKAFNIGEVWNPVCCHGNKTVKLVLWSLFWNISEINRSRDLSSSFLIKIWLSRLRHQLPICIF